MKELFLAPIAAAIALALAACGQNEAQRASEKAVPKRVAMTADAPAAPGSERSPRETGAPDSRPGSADRSVPGSESTGPVGERSRVEDGGTTLEERKSKGTARPDDAPDARPDAAPSARPDTPPGARH